MVRGFGTSVDFVLLERLRKWVSYSPYGLLLRLASRPLPAHTQEQCSTSYTGPKEPLTRIASIAAAAPTTSLVKWPFFSIGVAEVTSINSARDCLCGEALKCESILLRRPRSEYGQRLGTEEGGYADDDLRSNMVRDGVLSRVERLPGCLELCGSVDG